MEASEKPRPWYNPVISDRVLQWVGVAMSLFSIATACLAISGILQSPTFAWVVLFISVGGLLGPIAFLVDDQKWRFPTCLFAFVIFVCSLMLVMQGLGTAGL